MQLIENRSSTKCHTAGAEANEFHEGSTFFVCVESSHTQFKFIYQLLLLCCIVPRVFLLILQPSSLRIPQYADAEPFTIIRAELRRQAQTQPPHTMPNSFGTTFSTFNFTCLWLALHFLWFIDFVFGKVSVATARQFFILQVCADQCYV